MDCVRCGRELGADAHFCSHCGHEVGAPFIMFEDMPQETPLQEQPSQTPSSSPVPNKKRVRRIIAALCALAAIIALIAWNPFSLEKRLTKHTWYREYEDFYGSRCLEVLELHLNGDRVSKKYLYRSGEWISAGRADNLPGSWEIMEDREIYFKGHYYEWKDEWSLSGSKLIIGEYEYTSTPKKNYPD